MPTTRSQARSQASALASAQTSSSINAAAAPSTMAQTPKATSFPIKKVIFTGLTKPQPNKKTVMPTGSPEKSAEARGSAFGKATDINTPGEPVVASVPTSTPTQPQPMGEIPRYAFRARVPKAAAGPSTAMASATEKTTKSAGNSGPAKQAKRTQKPKGAQTGRVTKRALKATTTTLAGKQRNRSTIQTAKATAHETSDKGKGNAEVTTDKGENATETGGQKDTAKKPRVITWVFVKYRGMHIISEKIPPIVLGGGDTANN